MDLSKAFYTLDLDLLLAKLHGYDFNRDLRKVFNSYLSNRYHGTKIKKSFSLWSKIVFRVPQDSVLGPLLFNIYKNDLFNMTELTYVCNSADDTTFHACGSSLEDLVNRLEHDASPAISWFDYNYIKLNQDVIYFWSQIWRNLGKKCSEKNMGKQKPQAISRSYNWPSTKFWWVFNIAL